MVALMDISMQMSSFENVLLLDNGIPNKSNTSENFYSCLLPKLTNLGIKKSFRPALNITQPTVVNVSMTLYAVLEVDEKKQLISTFIWIEMHWYNNFLNWDPNECDGLEQASLPVTSIWTPDMYIYEYTNEEQLPYAPYVYVTYNGKMTYLRPLKIVGFCTLQVFNFPFDVQNCSLTFRSLALPVSDMRIQLAKSVEEILVTSKENFNNKGEWELIDIISYIKLKKLRAGNWDNLKFWVVIRRRPIQYVVSLVVPTSLLMLVDVLSFYMPPHCTDRAAFEMTILLGYVVFLLIVNDLLPSTATGIPVLSKACSIVIYEISEARRNFINLIP
ncbi:5-hydroxytryptamine receptor 3A-like [Protopterus annectens]|uniref:5-hydroxytryptamine receptor 3A-like n=1 Tax=Protopterus annectens TaxID=7888 RepID=UPI001CF99F61|nr:5-hydroxytryptamine receptor 3A-like [Protopterus annectens]